MPCALQEWPQPTYVLRLLELVNMEYMLTTLRIAFGGCLAVAQGAAKRDSVVRIVKEARFHEDALAPRHVDAFEASTDDEDKDTDEVQPNP